MIRHTIEHMQHQAEAFIELLVHVLPENAQTCRKYVKMFLHEYLVTNLSCSDVSVCTHVKYRFGLRMLCQLPDLLLGDATFNTPVAARAGESCP